MDEQQKEIQQYNQLLSRTNRLMISVQEAQHIINAYLGSPRRAYQQQYDSISADIYRQTIQIRDFLSQNDQQILLENMLDLLDEKNTIVRSLTMQFRGQNPLNELDRKIDDYNHLMRDSLIVTSKKDTTLILQEKKGFWSRLRALFNPGHPGDTTLKIASQEKDTLMKLRVDTVVYSDLKNITQEASKTYSSKIQGIERQVRDMVLAEQNISLQLSQLITELYNQTLKTAQKGIENSGRLSQRIFVFSIITGVLSLLLIMTIIFFIISDLNKGQRARMDLAREKQLTEELMESRHKLLLSVSHDIKTPLSSMMGYMELWNMEETSPARKKQLRSAQNSGKHILSLLTNLLEFSRLEQNTGRRVNSRFRLNDILNEIVDMFRPFTEEKNIRIAYRSQLPDSLFVETDYTILKQILSNVLSNAVKYTLKGGVTLDVKKEGRFIFVITDTGIGIDQKDRDKIFKPFSRINNTLRTEGTGFGLYVTKGLVDSLGGTIGIASKKEKGTTVTIELPLQEVEPMHPEALSPGARKDDVPSGKKHYRHVLIVEDDAALGNMIREFLTRQGYEVTLCSHLDEMKKVMQGSVAFDIVFTDMNMMTISGYDILHAIRKGCPTIPVWLMTAYDDYTEQKALKEGFDGFITKPIKMNALLSILSAGQVPDVSEKIETEFPLLWGLFNDENAIREILSKFVETTYRDTDQLEEFIRQGDFKAAQQLCHKMHPFLAQLNAEQLGNTLRKMDSLRGKDESAYPNWKDELAQTIRNLRAFADRIFLADKRR